jgi:uncharacterized protein YrrD
MVLSYREVVGKPVISLDDGSEVGTVRQAVVDPSAGRVVGLAIDNHRWWRPTRIALWEDVVAGAGGDVLLVTASSRLFSVLDRPEFEPLVADERRLLGTRVVTRGGRIAGRVASYAIDPATGRILRLELEEGGGAASPPATLPYERVMVLGRDVVVIAEDGDASHVKAAEQPARVAAAPEPQAAPQPVAASSEEAAAPEAAAATGFRPLPVIEALPGPAAPATAAATAETWAPAAMMAMGARVASATPRAAGPRPAWVASLAAAPVQQTSLASELASPALAAAHAPEPVLVAAPELDRPEPKAAPTGQAPAASATTTGADLARLFRERQERFLLGKVAGREVRSETGEALVRAGQAVDQEALEAAKAAGKLLELTASVSIRR